MDVYHAPQMKNWRNIMRPSLTLMALFMGVGLGERRTGGACFQAIGAGAGRFDTCVPSPASRLLWLEGGGGLRARESGWAVPRQARDPELAERRAQPSS